MYHSTVPAADSPAAGGAAIARRWANESELRASTLKKIKKISKIVGRDAGGRVAVRRQNAGPACVGGSSRVAAVSEVRLSTTRPWVVRKHFILGTLAR
jgi:hypothetical protein